MRFTLTYLTPSEKFPLKIQILNYKAVKLDKKLLKKTRRSLLSALANEVKHLLKIEKLPLNFFTGNGMRIFDIDQFVIGGYEQDLVIYC